MEQPPSVTKKALERITTQLKCSACQDTFTNAKLLPCFHSFCKKCLEHLVIQNHSGNTLTCPNCHRTTSLPPAGVPGLQNDFHIEHLFEIRDMLLKANNPQKKCEKCERLLATGFCRNCGQFVCNKCTELHQTRKEFSTHQIARISDIQKEALNLVPPTTKVMHCTKHPEKNLEIYCEACEELICNNCIIYLHQGHKYDLVTNIFPKHREEIVSSLQPVVQQLAIVNKAFQALDTRTKDIEDQRMTVEADIHKHIDCLHQALEQRRTELVSQLHQLTQQKLKLLAAQRKQGQLLQSQLSSCLDFVEGSLKTGSEGEILGMKTPVLKQIRQICDEFNSDTIAPELEENIQLVANDSLDLLQACKEFAGVVSQTVCPEKCYTTGDGLKAATVREEATVCPEKCYTTGDGLKAATVREEATVTLHARDKDGRECMEPIQNFTAVLVCIKDDTTTECQVKNEDRSKYMIKYKPMSRGNHELHIRIKGQKTKGSPFTVAVRPSLQTLGNPIRVIGNLKGPWGLATNSEGHIIAAEHTSHRVSVFTLEGKKICSFGNKGSENGQFILPTGVAVDNADNIYVVDHINHRIQKFTSTGEFTATAGTPGSKPLQFYNPVGIGFNKKNGKLYVCDNLNHRIQVLETDLTHHHSFGSRGSENGQFVNLWDIAFDSTGNVYVADYNNCRIQTFTPDGHFLQKFGTGQLQYPSSIAVHCDMVYVSEYNQHRVLVFSSNGKFLKSFGAKLEAQDQSKKAYGVAVDVNGFVLVANYSNNRVQIF